MCEGTAARRATPRGWMLAKLFCVVALFIPAASDFAVLVPHGMRIEGVPTSPFKFYGKLKGRETINGSAVVLRGRDLCYPRREDVTGKVVVAVRDHSLCDLEDSYIRLDDHGALVFVSITSTQSPGIFNYRHASVDPSVTSRRSLALLEVVKLDVASQGEDFDGILEGWFDAGKRGELRVLVGWPYDTFYQDIYESNTWLVIFRILAPGAALFTTIIGAIHSRNYYLRQADWGPGRVVCLWETGSTLLIAIAMICGLYGPILFPNAMGTAFLTLFNSVSNTTAMLLSLFMREASRSVVNRTRRQNVWQLHKGKLVAILITQAVLENGVFYVFGFFEHRELLNLFLYGFIFYVMFQIGMLVVYSYYSAVYVHPLQLFVQRSAYPTSSRQRDYIGKIKKLVFFLKLSAVCMAVQTICSLVALVFIFIERRHTGTYLFYGTFVFSRIALSYSQVRAIAAEGPTPISLSYSSLCRVFSAKRNAVVDTTSDDGTGGAAGRHHSLSAEEDRKRYSEGVAILAEILARNNNAAQTGFSGSESGGSESGGGDGGSGGGGTGSRGRDGGGSGGGGGGGGHSASRHSNSGRSRSYNSSIGSRRSSALSSINEDVPLSDDDAQVPPV